MAKTTKKDGKKADPNAKFKRKPGGGSASRTKREKGKKKRSNHSLNPERKVTGRTTGAGPTMRTKSTINRLRMYKNFKPVRDSKGKILKAAPFQGTLQSGTVARVEPHRKWFGNTRVVGQEQLQRFQAEMGRVLHDPFQIVMRQTRAPISLLQEKAKQQRVHILDVESFEHTFGKRALRKRANLKVTGLEELRTEAEQKAGDYVEANDRSLETNQERTREERTENTTPLFRAGQSARVWSELYKVIDSSDVVLEVLDARDPMGTRCRQVEEFLRKEKPHKHLVLVLNKVDLVPTWVTKKWMQLLSREMPTIAFHASIQHSFGKGSLISLLRQFYKLHRKDRQQLSIGLIGYPNVGKSSVVNTLRSKKVCKTAPLAGETKVWQYVALMKGLYLIDCPGVVYPPHWDTHTDLVLKGVVRVENVPDPENHVQAVLDRVRPEHLARHFNFVPKEGEEDKFWTDAEDFLAKIALASGRLLKGGEPDLGTVSRQILNDYQRGNIPHYVMPPGCERSGAATPTPSEAAQMADERPINLVEQDEEEEAMLTDSEFGGTLEGDEQEEVEVKEEEELDEDDLTGEKAIIRAILAKREEKMEEEDLVPKDDQEEEEGGGRHKEKEEKHEEGEEEDDGNSSVVTDFEFQLSTTDEEGGLGSIGSDLDEQFLEEEEKPSQSKKLAKGKPIGGKRPRGRRGGKKTNKTGEAEAGKGRRKRRTGRAAELLAAEEKKAGGKGEAGVVNFGGATKHDVPRNLWYKKLEKKRRKPKHQV